MQTIRGTKDILPSEIKAWQDLYFKALKLFTIYNYSEIRTPILERTEVFLKSVGNSTDILRKEMYRFIDRGQRDIALRPEGTACIARAVASNKLYLDNPIQKLWYMGPMFRYERPQQGRQRQFHQLGLECMGSEHPLADVEVIAIAHNILKKVNCCIDTIEINSLGSEEERAKYKLEFMSYLENYKDDLDHDSKERLNTNPLRILDSKNEKIQNIIQEAPCISNYLSRQSEKHFDFVCEQLDILNIPYKINRKLVRGLDYYNHTAFEIISNQLGSHNTVCGGGRYSHLVEQFGGPNMTGVGWAIGIERLLMAIDITQINNKQEQRFDIVTEGTEAQKKSWDLIKILEKHNIVFNLHLSSQGLNKQIKRAIQNKAIGCIIIGKNEIKNFTVTVKWINEYYQETIKYSSIITYLQEKLKQYNAKSVQTDYLLLE